MNPSETPDPESAQPKPSPPAITDRLAVGGVLVLAAAWRIADAFIHPWSPDQLFSVRLAGLPWAEMLAATTADVHPPFYYALLKVWFLAAPDTLSGAKMLSIAFSVATLLAIREIARDAFGDRAGWIAFLAASFSPYAVFWSHTTRNHAILPLFVACSCLFGWRYLREPSGRNWWLTAVFLALAFQTNYMGLVFGALWCIAMILERGVPLLDRLRLCGAGAPGAILFAPWVAIMFEHTTRREFNPGFFQEQLSPAYLYYHALFGRMEAYQPPQAGVMYLAFGLFAVVCGIGLRALRSRPTLGFLLVALPLVPILLVKFGSMTLAERHLLFTLPLFYAYFGGAVVEVWARIAPRGTT